MRSMHIAFVLDESWPTAGGIATHYHYLCQLLTDAGHRVTLLLDHEPIAIPEIKNLRAVDLSAAISARRSELRWAYANNTGSFRRQISFGLAARDWLRDNAASEQIDVVETMDVKGFGALLLDSQLPPLTVMAHGPMACEVRNQQIFLTRGLKLQTSLELVLLALADSAGAPSQAYAEDWSRLLERRVRYAPPPWMVNDAPRLAASAMAREPFRILVIGRLERRKGPLETAAACRLLREQSVEVNVRWAGRSDLSAPGGRDMAEHVAAEFPDIWGKSFTHLGVLSRDQVAAEIDAAAAIVTPSLKESFNYTVLEAIGRGKPVIVSSGAGVSNLLTHEKDALIVPPGDSVALASAIRRLAEDRQLRANLADSALATLTAELSPQRVLSARYELYEAAIERRQLRKNLLCEFEPVRALLAEVSEGVEFATFRELEQMPWTRLSRKLLGRVKRKFLAAWTRGNE